MAKAQPLPFSASLDVENRLERDGLALVPDNHLFEARVYRGRWSLVARPGRGFRSVQESLVGNIFLTFRANKPIWLMTNEKVKPTETVRDDPKMARAIVDLARGVRFHEFEGVSQILVSSNVSRHDFLMATQEQCVSHKLKPYGELFAIVAIRARVDKSQKFPDIVSVADNVDGPDVERRVRGEYCPEHRGHWAAGEAYGILLNAIKARVFWEWFIGDGGVPERRSAWHDDGWRGYVDPAVRGDVFDVGDVRSSGWVGVLKVGPPDDCIPTRNHLSCRWILGVMAVADCCIWG